MYILETGLQLLGAVLLALLFGGWNSTVIQRMAAAYLAARADSIEEQRLKMKVNHKFWKDKIGVVDEQTQKH